MSNIFFNRLSDICHDLLYLDHKLFKYLTDRNLSAATISKYNIGAFPRDLRILLNKMHHKELMDNGIIWNASESTFKYNNVYYPIVIPIKNVYDETIAIACRTLSNDGDRSLLGIPKYKNSEYKKSNHLYGLNYAVDDIVKEDRAFVVEGYFDVIACHQAGIKNVVAACGTWLSRRQVIMLSRYTNNIILLFDNDAPGHTSANNTMQRFSNDIITVNLTCKFTPKGYKDIDEYLCRGGELNFFVD